MISALPAAKVKWSLNSTVHPTYPRPHVGCYTPRKLAKQ